MATGMAGAFDTAFIDAIAEAVAEKIMARMPASGFGGKRLLTIDEAAAIVGRSKDAMYQLVNRRRIPAVKEGRRVHIEREELERWIERNRRVE